MTSLKTSIKTITYLSDTGCLEIQGASLLYKHHVTANHITLTALALSLFTGLLLVLVAQPILFLLLPIVLFIRMALNALDGMLAREWVMLPTY